MSDPAGTPSNEIAPLLQRWIEAAIEAAAPGHVPLLMISGAQGSGKTSALAEAIRNTSRRVVGASLDDFYTSPFVRSLRGPKGNPLFAVRGPPGTHKLSQLNLSVSLLRSAGPGAVTLLPLFDKVADRPAPLNMWRKVHGRPEAVVIEGWMMGVLPDPGAPDSPPLNAVEARDTDGVWRGAQEGFLAEAYADLWDLADGFLHILAPDFSCVAGWRMEQEAGLRAARGEVMTDEHRAWVLDFIQYYERLTRRMLAGGRRPGAEIHIDAQRRVIRTSGL